jgi:diadenosine tetraphosphate (Ap4A) HIT family hydrolase/predicted house-cleaning noncanonical NTP pyrophosphatase (MazG superfamily)
MTQKCFFCDIQKQEDDKKIIENEDFFSRYDGFPVSDGHAEIIPKFHAASIFELSTSQIQNLFLLLGATKEVIKDKFSPNGFNVGINDGESAGQSIFHLHVHLIPRYIGDVKNPRGGVRNIFPDKADYTSEIKKIESRKDYVSGQPRIYEKLVRDKIPEIIKSKGENPVTHIADDKEYRKMIREKLMEEVNEYLESGHKKELSDILEVIYAICDFEQIDFKQIEAFQKDKKQERGGFADRIILDRVE